MNKIKTVRKFLINKEEGKILIQHLDRLGVEPTEIETYFLEVMRNDEEGYVKEGNTCYFFKQTEMDIEKGFDSIKSKCTLEEYEKNKAVKVGFVMNKERFTIESDYITHIDKYYGNLRGLYICELEFFSKKDSEELELPDFCAGEKEITDDPAFSNFSLITKGSFENIKK